MEAADGAGKRSGDIPGFGLDTRLVQLRLRPDRLPKAGGIHLRRRRRPQIMPLVDTHSDRRPRWSSWLRTLAFVSVLASALGSVGFIGLWVLVRTHGPLSRSMRDGSTVVRWDADEDGIGRGVIQEPVEGVPAPPARMPEPFRGYTTRASWPTRYEESFWFRRVDRTERHFVPPVPSVGAVSINDDAVRRHPGVDVRTTWTVLYPGRIAATLAVPAVAWIVFVVCRLLLRSSARVRGVRRQDGKCPRCRYDLRATRERCPECGWIAPLPVDSEKLAARLSKVR